MARCRRSNLFAAFALGVVCAGAAFAWDPGPTAPFALNRFDAGYFPGDGKVYFLGGRFSDGTTDGSIWSFDPLAGTYADTGVDLAVPISNYTMNLVHDADGWKFYVFCGRAADGSQTRTVQFFSPGDSSVGALPAADDYPGSLACGGAMNVVYKDRVYVVGGFDSLTPPYNHGETWVFDPMAATGSRWTDLGTSLAVPRSYISGTVFDGKIWAIGGSYFDGSALVNTATVEVLDPKVAPPLWSDAAAPDLPEGCSEGRAWSIDHRWGYRTTEWSGAADRILAACGAWSDPSERTYLFEGATGTWSPGPPLATARRSEAAELLFPRSGSPGLWLWGGRGAGGDNDVLATSEHIPLLPSNCDVLLVEDDGVPAGFDGGFPYYWSTLDWMGFPYTHWHRGEGGVPPAATLNAHEVVVWYTGAAYGDVVNAADQTALITYLNGGGNALLSSVDQLYAHGATPLTTTYFGVGSFVNDGMYDTTHGCDGDPMSSHLGIYHLVEPTDFDDYWPATYLYSDEVHAGAGAVDALLWETVHVPSAVRKQGPTYRTQFLAWPFEWIDTISERVEMMGNSLHWLCPIHRDGFESGDWQEWYTHVP